MTSPDVADERPVRMLFAHTSAISALFVAGQIEYVANAGMEPHYAAAWDDADGPPALGCPTWRLPLVRPPAPLRDLRALAASVRLLRRLRPHIVHAGTPKAGLVVTMAALLTRRPVRIYAVHGLRFETATGLMRTALRSMERLAIACATDVVADSASIREVLIADLGAPASKVHVLGPGSGNGVEVERFRNGLDRATARRDLGIEVGAVVLGFVGRLTRDKGVDDLVAIHREVSADRPIVLLLVGEFEPDDPVRADTRDHIEHDDQVVRVAWTDRPEDVYGAMDLLVFASAREGLPNVPLEAQAAGVPVVGYAATGTVDAVADTDLLVPVGDVGGLRRLIEERIASPEQLRLDGRSAQTWVRAFDRPTVWRARLEFARRRLSERRSAD